MSKQRKSLLIAIFTAALSCCLLWIAFWWATPAQAAPRPAPDADTTIISMTRLAASVNDVIYDPIRHLLYASRPSVIGAEGNRILPIAVPTGALGVPLFVGSEPNHLALSADGQYLYVGIDGAHAVRRVNLISYTADLQIPLGGSDSCGGYVAEDIVVLQDNPQSIAVAKRGSQCSSHQGVSIFDNATARPDSTNEDERNNAIEPSLDPAVLYGYNNEDSSYGLHTLVISPTGIAVSTTHSGLVDGYVDILFDDGLLYSTGGDVVDPATMTLLGSYSGYGPIAPDSANGVVYRVDGDYFSPPGLKMFDQDEFTPLDSWPFFNFSESPRRLFLVDSENFVMLTTSGNLYLITLGELTPLPPNFISTPAATVVEAIQYNYYITATDPNYGDVPVITPLVQPSWLQWYGSYNGQGTLYGTPNHSNLGANPVELLLTDSQGLTTTQRFTITVTANPAFIAPTFTSSPPLSATVDANYSYDITTDDENEGEYRYVNTQELPDWLYLSDYGNGTAYLNGYPRQADIGEHLVKLQVTDSQGLTATQQFTLVVVSAVVPHADGPAFGSTPVLGAAEGITYTYIVTAATTQAGAQVGEPLTISAPILPAWLTLTPLVNGASILKGMAASADIGEHPVTLVVTDSHGLSDTQSFTLTVVAVGEVRGMLFDDVNDNGRQDAGEVGIAEATVSLTPAAGTLAALAIQQGVITTTTNITGVYQFANVPTGSYTLTFELPGDRLNPPALGVVVNASVPTTVLPVAVAVPVDNSQYLYLPNVQMQEDAARGVEASRAQAGK